MSAARAVAVLLLVSGCGPAIEWEPEVVEEVAPAAEAAPAEAAAAPEVWPPITIPEGMREREWEWDFEVGKNGRTQKTSNITPEDQAH